MDFNKAFSSYDSIEGARCQTNAKKQSQEDAAMEAVHVVGLNQIAQVKEEWFNEPEWWEMFCVRLALVKNVARAR